MPKSKKPGLKVKIFFVGKLSDQWESFPAETLLAGNWKFEQWYTFKTKPKKFVVDQDEMVIPASQLEKLPKVNIQSARSKALHAVLLRVFPIYGFEQTYEQTEEYKNRCRHFQHHKIMACTLQKDHEGPHLNIHAAERWNDSYGVYINSREEWRKYLYRYQAYWKAKTANMTPADKNAMLQREFFQWKERNKPAKQA